MRYARVNRIRTQLGKLELIDARSDHPLVTLLQHQGYDLNEGMVLMLEDTIYHGAAALEVMARISGRVGLFNRINYLVFRHHLVAKGLYPILRGGRNLLLKLLGRQKIEPA